MQENLQDNQFYIVISTASYGEEYAGSPICAASYSGGGSIARQAGGSEKGTESGGGEVWPQAELHAFYHQGSVSRTH